MSYSGGSSGDAFIWFAPEESIQMVFKTLRIDYKPQKPGDSKDSSFGVENPVSIGSATSGAGEGKSSFGEFQTGPGGDEIAPDKYGRIKVKFFWDRDGKTGGNSSASSAPCTWCPR